VPTPILDIVPFSPIDDGMVGNPQEIHCTVGTVSGVFFNSVMILWTNPEGNIIVNDSRVTVDPTTSIDNDYISTLKFAYLMEGDEGIYTCNVMMLETFESQIIEVGNLTGKQLYNYNT